MPPASCANAHVAPRPIPFHPRQRRHSVFLFKGFGDDQSRLHMPHASVPVLPPVFARFLSVLLVVAFTDFAERDEDDTAEPPVFFMVAVFFLTQTLRKN